LTRFFITPTKSCTQNIKRVAERLLRPHKGSLGAACGS